MLLGRGSLIASFPIHPAKRDDSRAVGGHVDVLLSDSMGNARSTDDLTTSLRSEERPMMTKASSHPEGDNDYEDPSLEEDETDPITPRPFVRHRHVIRMHHSRQINNRDQTGGKVIEQSRNIQIVDDAIPAQDGGDEGVGDDECRLLQSTLPRCSAHHLLRRSSTIDPRRQRHNPLPSEVYPQHLCDADVLFKRQMFSSLRSTYGSDGRQPRRRPNLLPLPARSSSCSVRSSISLSNLEMTKAISSEYLETARQKKQSVEQCLFKTWPSMETVKQPSSRSSTAAETVTSSAQQQGLIYLNWIRQVLGSVPSYIELKDGRLHLKLIQDDVVEHIDGAVKVGEITELLRAEYAVVTGGRSKEGRPIITFPDRCNFGTLAEENYRKLIVYLTSVPALHDADLGYVLIVDRRTDRWNAVKATLLRLSNFFPGLIAVVYVLRPSGLLQKAISEVSNKFFREDFKFKVVICSCLDDLHQRIDATQLTAELGGCLFYNHQEWIDTRVAVESFSANTADIGAALRKFSRRLQDTELPNDVATTQSVLLHQGQDYATLKKELRNAGIQGETLLGLIKKPSGQRSRVMDPWPGQLVNITAVERLLIQCEETQRTLDEFWNRHAAHLNLCLQLRQFELDFRELQVALDEDIQSVTGLAADGDSVLVIDSLLRETLDRRALCQADLDRADALFEHASKLMAEYADSPVVLDSVRPKSVELQRMSHTLRELFIHRLESLDRSRDLYHRIENANRWCAEGVDLLASQQLEKCSSPEFALRALTDIEDFLASAKEYRDPNQVRALFQDVLTPETKSLIHQVAQRLQDVQVMCERRANGLKQFVTRVRIGRPIQSVPNVDSSPQSRPKPEEPSPQNAVKLRHVLTELLETERIYVNEISIILKGYRDPLIDPYQQQSVPPQLADKSDVLFGNLPEIGSFHGEILLPDLESSLSSPKLVASCFLRHTEDLHSLYSYYCQNIPQSEELRRQVGEQNNPFLRQCQSDLGHKLPLSAYLLKPVQRITKYQLLLKDLIKYSESSSNTETTEDDDLLQSALDAMLGVVRCVNDSMHQVAISGYQGSLAELGRLLLQGGFSMWAEGKRDRGLRELRLKAMQRHVFLYERGVVLCKRVGKDPDKATYQFKHLLKMSEVGLTETVHSGKGSDARKFELWLQGRHEVWVLQAPSRDVKETWITEIKRVLLNQFHQLKGQTMQNPSSRTSITPHAPKISNNDPSSTYAPKSLRTPSSCSSWEYNNSIRTGGGNSSSSSGVSSVGDRSSLVDSTSASSSTSRTSTGSRQMLRSSTTMDEEDGWSTDFSLSDEDMGDAYLDHVEPLRRRYVALADYAPLGPTEASLKEGEIVDLIRIGCAGWWYVRPATTSTGSQEGWAPSAYLEAAPSALKSPCSSGTPSVSSHDSEHDHLQ